MRFDKYQGTGNDFIVVQEQDAPDALRFDTEVWSRADHPARHWVRAWCKRHTGVGADGVIICGAQDRFRMGVINADGTVPEMCGNGLRCLAHALCRWGSASERDEFVVHTDAGPHRCKVDTDHVTIAMRPPDFAPQAVGLDDSDSLEAPGQGSWVDHPWFREKTHTVSLRDATWTTVSMGNPHVVTFSDMDEQSRAALGPRLSQHADFASGVNVGFASLVSPQHIRLVVHERGAGWTLACGTGACAAVVAAVRTGRVQPSVPVRVSLPGGDLTIVVDSWSSPVTMTGPATHVFSGDLSAG